MGASENWEVQAAFRLGYPKFEVSRDKIIPQGWTFPNFPDDPSPASAGTWTSKQFLKTEASEEALTSSDVHGLTLKRHSPLSPNFVDQAKRSSLNTYSPQWRPSYR